MTHCGCLVGAAVGNGVGPSLGRPSARLFFRRIHAEPPWSSAATASLRGSAGHSASPGREGTGLRWASKMARVG